MRYNGLYEVSNLGRVKSVERTRKGKCGSTCRVRERVLKAYKDKNGYLLVNLSKGGIRKKHLIHILVAQAFIPNPNNYPIINHKDDSYEGRSNDSVENLEWCTYEYNNNYGHRNERLSKSLTNRSDQSKTVYQYTKNYELVGEYPSTQEVARQTGWHCGNISACCRGERKTANGFIWSYTVL